MRITPADLQPDPLTLDVSLEPGVIEYAPDVLQRSTLHVSGLADRLEEHRGPRDFVEDIRIRAAVTGDFELLCARCLQSIPYPAALRFDLIFRPAGVDAEQGERAISEAETEIGYYEQSGLVLEHVVREQVLLSLPERSLCKEDCRGLCPSCGSNLNEAACNCNHAMVDPRWNGLHALIAADKR